MPIVYERDIVGDWFKAVASLDQDTNIQFGRIDEPGSEPVWMPLSHQRFDGVGGFVKLLRESGHRIDAIPTLKDERTPRLMRVVVAWARYLFRRRPTYRWPPLPSPGPASGPWSAIATHIFDEGGTRRVATSARALGITVNTLLLDRLTRAVRRTIVGRPREVAWMIPINMRGGVELADETTNHSSFLEIPVLEDEPVTRLQDRIRGAVTQNQHWSFWYSFQFGRVFGRAGRRLFMRLAIHGRSHWVGSFSNLGVWNPPADGPEPYAWVFFPPPVPSQPIGVGCVTYRGRLGLAMQLHPSLTTDPRVAAEWLEAAVAELSEAAAPGE